MAQEKRSWHKREPDGVHQAFQVKVGPQGRIVIPAALREQLGFKEGTVLSAGAEDGSLVLETPQNALRRLQEEFSKHVPPGVSLVDELLAERREEARRENEEA
ncbi:MAG: AbrB/MazE/SpoVT family DNA-binding domain-containing protein [Chloroflexi bacterium]|nr:AbrB/MazE/SpoVT family DNA-binding domain-containing protein [Chloroflexota bacterium]